jgi:Tol biopolymer transport system component
MKTCLGRLILICAAAVLTVFGDLGEHRPLAAASDEKIVFTNANPASPFPTAEIYIMNPEGSDALRLTNDGFGDGLPSLSPGGKGKIVFDSNRTAVALGALPTSTNSDLFLMNADGTADGEQFPTPLTRGSSATWSPGGKWIAFHRSASGTYGTRIPGRTEPGGPTTDSDILVMNVDDFLQKGVGPTNLTNGLPTLTEGLPPGVRGLYASDDADWSPDGEKIAFTSRIPNDPSTAGIYVMNLMTGDITRLTFCGKITPPCDILSALEERSPDWSPDGTRIAFMRRRAAGQPFEIWVMDVDPETLAVLGEHRLTDNAYVDSGPSWSPTGNEIVFQTVRPASEGGALLGQQVWVMDADGSNQRPLTGPAAPEGALQGVNLFPNWGKVAVGQAHAKE